MNNFKDLGLSPQIVKVLPELGFVAPTEIQNEAIPILVNNNHDFIGLANTGTGKTGAFGLPLLSVVDPGQNHVQALILAPTRELSQQIAHQLIAFAKYSPQLKISVVYGGANISPQIKELKKGVQVVVATPGRLIDLLKRKALKLENIQNVVLDEADEMLNMGFKEEIDHILAYTPQEKKTWLFSATMPKEIRRLVKQYMTDPVEISVHSGNLVNENIDHRFMPVKPSDKTEAISRIISLDAEFRGVIFCRTKMDTQSLSNELNTLGVKSESLHGDLNQKQRDHVMSRFKSHHLQVLVATDVAARGIDVNDLTHVIHHTLPDDVSYYTHRSGRTARAGKKGISLALVEKKNVSKMKMLERKLSINFSEVQVPDEKDIINVRLTNWVENLLTEEETTKVDPKQFKKVLAQFEGVSKEDIIYRLIQKELKGLQFRKKPEKLSLKENTGKGKKGSKKGGKGNKSRKSSSDGSTLFINLGSVDGFNKNALADFVSDQSSIEKKKIKHVQMFERHSFIDVDHKIKDRVIKSFKDKKLGSHTLRVNQD